MAFNVGDTLPEATFGTMGAEGPGTLSSADIAALGKAVIFALPGAYTGTCSTAHFPSFVRTADALREKGVEAIYCLSNNDVFTLKAWGDSLGGDAAGITMLADIGGAFSKGAGMSFTAEPLNLIDRSLRYAMVVESGKITMINVEDNPGVCDLSAGEAVLEAL
ncbi:MAG: peroxiredoxin [Pseudomonadota bacterium]